MLFQDGKFQWKRLENLIQLAKEGSRGSADAHAGASSSGRGAASSASSSSPAFGGTLFPSGPFGGLPLPLGSSMVVAGSGSSGAVGSSGGGGGLDLSDTVKDALRVLLLDDKLRTQVLLALTEDNKLHVDEVMNLLRLVQVGGWGWARDGRDPGMIACMQGRGAVLVCASHARVLHTKQ